MDFLLSPLKYPLTSFCSVLFWTLILWPDIFYNYHTLAAARVRPEHWCAVYQQSLHGHQSKGIGPQYQPWGDGRERKWDAWWTGQLHFYPTVVLMAKIIRVIQVRDGSNYGPLISTSMRQRGKNTSFLGQSVNELQSFKSRSTAFSQFWLTNPLTDHYKSFHEMSNVLLMFFHHLLLVSAAEKTKWESI